MMVRYWRSFGRVAARAGIESKWRADLIALQLFAFIVDLRSLHRKALTA
jgi:hypothetical protein